MSIRLYMLNGESMQTPGQMHDHLSTQFELASHYGRNLDALWDMLSERGEGGAILLTDSDRMPKELLLPLLGLLTDLAGDNSRWSFKALSAEYLGVNPLLPRPITGDNTGAGEEAE